MMRIVRVLLIEVYFNKFVVVLAPEILISVVFNSQNGIPYF